MIYLLLGYLLLLSLCAVAASSDRHTVRDEWQRTT